MKVYSVRYRRPGQADIDFRSSRNPVPPRDRLHLGVPMAVIAFAALAVALLWTQGCEHGGPSRYGMTATVGNIDELREDVAELRREVHAKRCRCQLLDSTHAHTFSFHVPGGTFERVTTPCLGCGATLVFERKGHGIQTTVLDRTKETR